MKKFYKYVMAAVVALCAQSASAIKVTLNVDNPDAVTVSVNGENKTVGSSNEFDVEASSSIYVNGKEGYRIMSCTNAAGTPAGTLYASANMWYNYIYPVNEGDVYNLTTISADAFRDTKCTILVDDASAVEVTRSNTYEKVDNLVSGQAVEVAFNKEQELPLMLMATNGRPFYSVTVNGKAVEATTYCNLEPENGDQIVVTTQYPDKDCHVTFQYTNPGTEAFITSVQVDYQEVANFNEGFTVKAGQQLVIYGNTIDYQFNNMRVGGETVTYMSSYSPYACTVVGDLNIIVDAEKYATFSTTFNVNMPEAVVLMGDIYNPENTTIALTGQSSTVERSQKNATVYLMAKSGYTIDQILINGEPIDEYSYNSYSKSYRIDLKEGMVVDVTVSEISYDNKAIVYVNVDPSAITYFCFENSERQKYDLVKGYNEVGFAMTQNPFAWSWYNGNTVGQVFVNGELQSPLYPESANYQKSLNNGDVVRIYVGEASVKKYSVSFEGATSAVTLTKDIVTPAVAESQNVFPGTRFEFTPVSGSVVVSANGVEIEPVDGKITYDVNAKTTFTITEGIGTGIESVATEAAHEVYTLQGSRVKGGNPRPGLYIVNGKKTIIK